MNAWIQDVEVETTSMADVERLIADHDCGMTKAVFELREQPYHGQRYVTWRAKLAEMRGGETREMENEIDQLADAYDQHQEALGCDQISDFSDSIWHCWRETDFGYASVSLIGLVTGQGVGRIDPQAAVVVVTDSDGFLRIEKGRRNAFCRETCRRLCPVKFVASGAVDGRHDSCPAYVMQILPFHDMQA